MKKISPICKFWSIEPLECEQGHGKAQMTITENHINGLGIVHGGALFTLADITMIMTITGGGNHCVTLSSNISYLNPARIGPLVAEAILISETKKIAHIEVAVNDGEGILVCRCTFIAYKKPAITPAPY
jgi:acyl-CoA thioesterase